MPAVASYDMDFAVPFRHRLRFTRDALGADSGVLAELLEADGSPRVLICADDGVIAGDATLETRLVAWAESHASLAGPLVRVPGGEACKNDPAVVEGLLAAFDKANLDRRNYVVVVGGGAVLDCVGFAAAIAHRGIRLVRLPTTTLAQTDSGVGVKNAVNTFNKKNWRGTFAVPWAVVNDERLLQTLPDREFRAGFSEAIKVSLLKEPAFFERLCADAPKLAARDAEACRYAIERSAYWHLHHITRGGDPFEQLEARPLDFGHWAAHRMEAMTGFRLPHGEAVAAGLAIDCLYSHYVCGLPADDARRILACLAALDIPIFHDAALQTDALLAGAEEFRQHLGGRLTLTMLRGVGDPIEVHELDAAAVRHAIGALHQWQRDPRPEMMPP